MGIIADFSEWQQTIDWSKVSELHKNGTIDGVILRVQAGYTHPDARYEEYVSGCRQYSIPFGTYAYFKGISVNDAIREADNAFALTDKDSKCFAVDIEEATMADLVSGGQAFIDRLKAQGMTNVGLYSYKGFYDMHNLGAIKADWRWIAGYGVNDGQPHTDPQVAGEFLWQFTSVAHLDGVSTNVDESKEVGFNFFGGNVTQIITPAKFVMTVKVLCDTDVRAEPSHDSGYVKDAHKDEIYNVIQIQNDWHQVALTDSTTGWIDGNNGQNLYWLDNPALKQAPAAPQPVYHTVVSGDTVSKLAAANGTTTAQIVAWNGLKSADKIFVGQKLRVK